eukprot:jgi/Phyca11/529235/estExt2_fgenesh1_pm.C_PHYCAscaffold_400066
MALLRGLKFYLTRTLERDAADEVHDLIEQHGGVVSASPVDAMQLVDYEKLDSRRPEWVSVDFIKDSVASGTLQDPKKYSGLVFSSKPVQSHKKTRARYSIEDDARMLHFAKLRGWKSMNSTPSSTWKDAENEQVTNHSWQSMHEHFKKKLQSKTPKEQRAIMSKAVEIIRTRLRRQEAAEEEEQKEEAASVDVTSPTPAAAREAPPTPATSSPPQNQKGKKAMQKRKRVVESSPDEKEEIERIDDDSLEFLGVMDPRQPVKRFATETETDHLIAQLQLETNQDTICVVHALYYCSGDTNMARRFLKGASPAGMWSPDDDLLLVNLVADENSGRSAVAAALARGDFKSMQRPRSTDEILARVQFLR